MKQRNEGKRQDRKKKRKKKKENLRENEQRKKKQGITLRRKMKNVKNKNDERLA